MTRPVPSPSRSFTLPEFQARPHPLLERPCRKPALGLHGGSGVCATRQSISSSHRTDWSPIGGGPAVPRRNQKYGRTGQTRLIAPIGDSHRRAAERIGGALPLPPLGANYPYSSQRGSGQANSDGALRINTPSTTT